MNKKIQPFIPGIALNNRISTIVLRGEKALGAIEA
jgi:hypothetical protein